MCSDLFELKWLLGNVLVIINVTIAIMLSGTGEEAVRKMCEWELNKASEAKAEQLLGKLLSALGKRGGRGKRESNGSN